MNPLFNRFHFKQGVVVLKELIFNSFYLVGGFGGLERTLFNSFYFWEGVVVLKELILTVSTLWEGVAVLKELIFNMFLLVRGMWWFLKEPISTVSKCGVHGVLERHDFQHYLLVEGVMVLKELIF